MPLSIDGPLCDIYAVRQMADPTELDQITLITYLTGTRYLTMVEERPGGSPNPVIFVIRLLDSSDLTFVPDYEIPVADSTDSAAIMAVSATQAIVCYQATDDWITARLLDVEAGTLGPRVDLEQDGSASDFRMCYVASGKAALVYRTDPHTRRCVILDGTGTLMANLTTWALDAGGPQDVSYIQDNKILLFNEKNVSNSWLPHMQIGTVGAGPTLTLGTETMVDPAGHVLFLGNFSRCMVLSPTKAVYLHLSDQAGPSQYRLVPVVLNPTGVTSIGTPLVVNPEDWYGTNLQADALLRLTDQYVLVHCFRNEAASGGFPAVNDYLALAYWGSGTSMQLIRTIEHAPNPYPGGAGWGTQFAELAKASNFEIVLAYTVNNAIERYYAVLECPLAVDERPTVVLGVRDSTLGLRRRQMPPGHGR